MKRLWGPIISLILMGLFSMACGQATLPSPATELKTLAATTAAPISKADREQKWETILSEAKKEGTVSVYGIWRPDTRNALAQAFKNQYDINLEFSPFSRGSDLLAKVQAENRAGLYLADIFGAGTATLIVLMKPAGLLAPIKPLLILPEVLDPKAWREGNIPFADDEGLALGIIGQTTRNLAYNTSLITEGALTSYKDLLKPQYKGKIALNDPTVTGAGNAIMTYLGHDVWGEAETMDFLRRLIREQEVVIMRDTRTHVESVARGKYAVAMAPTTEIVLDFIRLGAPIKIAMVKEDRNLTAGAGAFGVPTKFGHPNAAIVFVNWLLTKAGQSVFAKSWGSPPARLDVSTEGSDPLFIPIPGEKYYSETTESLAARAKWIEIAKKIMEEPMK